jgi:RNA polymerase sigma-70 factor (ECF subfamily)
VPPADERLQIYLAHRAALVEYALPIVGDRMRAEDVVQEAFIRFAPGNDSQGEAAISQPLGYLYRIVRNLAYDFTRRRAAEQRHDSEGRAWWSVPQSPRTPEQELSHRQDLEQVEAVLAGLPPRVRRAVEMHRLGGHTLQEIADELGVSLNTAHRWVREAVVALALRLSDPAD